MNLFKQKILDIPLDMPRIKLCAILRYQNFLNESDLKEIKDQWKYVTPFINLPDFKENEDEIN